MRKHSRGFTLLELLITATIIGILAAIALPSYSQYVLRSNRTVGKTAIMKLVGQQESFFTDRKTYATSWALLLGSTWSSPIYVKKSGDLDAATGTDRVYSLTLAAYDASGLANCSASGSLTGTVTQYIIVATPINQQTKDTGCGKICYSSLGEKSKSGTSTDCWSR